MNENSGSLLMLRCELRSKIKDIIKYFCKNISEEQNEKNKKLFKILRFVLDDDSLKKNETEKEFHNFFIPFECVRHVQEAQIITFYNYVNNFIDTEFMILIIDVMSTNSIDILKENVKELNMMIEMDLS